MGLLTVIPKTITALLSWKFGADQANISTLGLSAALKTLEISPTMLAISALIAVVAGGIAIFNAVTTSTEEWDKALSDSKNSLSQAQEETKSLNDELKTTQERIDELNGKEKLTLTEEGELERLKQQNAELKKKIELSELAKKQANKEVNKNFVETMSSDLGNENEFHLGNLPQTETINKLYQSKVSPDPTFASQRDMISEQEYIKYSFVALDELKAKLRKSSTQKEKESIQTEIDSIEKFLSDKQTEFKTRSDGISYIQNPQNDDERNLNAWLDYIDDFNNQMLIKLGDTDAINTVWENLWTSDKYSDATSKLKELSKQGKLTGDSIEKLAKSDSNIKAFIDKLKELGLIDTDNLDAVANQINGVADAVNNTSSTKIEEKSFSDIYEDIKDKAKLVATAEKEMSDNGVVATDTMAELIEKGLATEDQFTNTAKGFTLSDTALKNLNKTALASYENDLNNAKKAANAVIEAEGGKALAISATTDEYINQFNALIKVKEATVSEGIEADYKLNAAQRGINSDILSDSERKQLWNKVVAGRAASKNVSSLKKELNDLTKTNSYYKSAQKLLNSINNDVNRSSKSNKSSSSNKTAGDLALEKWNAQKKAWRHQLEMGQISEATYHNTLNKYYKQYLKNYSETLDERRAMEEDWHKWQITNAQNTWNLNNNAWKHQLEMGEISEASYYAAVKKYYKKILGSYEETLDQRRQIEEELHQWQITNAQNTWNEQNNAKKHALAMGEITEKQYYDWVKANYKKMLGTYKETLDERRSIEEDYYNWVTEQETKRLELIQTKLDGAKSAIDDLLEEEIDRLNEQKDTVEKAYQAEIDALQEKNEEKEKEINLEEKALALAKSRNQRTVMQYTAQGMRYVADKTEVKSAQKDYDDALLQQKIDYLEQQKENAAQAFESQIEVYNQYKDLWQDAVDAQQKAQNKMYANTQLWANWEQAALQGNIDLLNNFIDKYNQASKNVELNAVKNGNSDLTANEVNAKYTLIPDVIDATKLQTAMADFKDSINTLVNGNLKKITEEFNTSQNITTKATSNVFNGGITINKPISDVDSLSRAIIEKLPMYMSQYCGS